jgi:hypothetical protein
MAAQPAASKSFLLTLGECRNDCWIYNAIAW